MGRKYLASLLAVAMFAAGVPCAQAEELDTNTANITDSQTIQGEAQDTGSSDEGTVSSNGTDDALNASADSQIAGRTVENIDKGWMFSKGDASMDGWTFPTGASEGTIDLPHSWDYAHPTMSYIPQNNQKTVTYSKQLDVAKVPRQEPVHQVLRFQQEHHSEGRWSGSGHPCRWLFCIRLRSDQVCAG